MLPNEVDKFSDDHLVSVNEVNLKSLVDRYPNLDVKQDWQEYSEVTAKISFLKIIT